MSGEPRSKQIKSSRIEDSAERLARIAAAKQQFLDTSLNMGWQLAVTVLVPVFIGVQLDKKFDTSPSYTLGALFLAVFMASAVVAKTLRGVKISQAQSTEGRNKRSAK